MKAVLLLLMAMLVVKTTTAAQGQDACSKSYISCVDQCVGKPTPSLQGSCIESCQSQNNVCAGKVFGGENLSSAKTVTPEEMAAREEAKAAAKPVAKPAKSAPARQMAAPAKPAVRRAQ